MTPGCQGKARSSVAQPVLRLDGHASTQAHKLGWPPGFANLKRAGSAEKGRSRIFALAPSQVPKNQATAPPKAYSIPAVRTAASIDIRPLCRAVPAFLRCGQGQAMARLRCVSHVDRIHMGDTPGSRRRVSVAPPATVPPACRASADVSSCLCVVCAIEQAFPSRLAGQGAAFEA